MAELVSFKRTVGGRDVVFEFEAVGRGGPIKAQIMAESPTKNLQLNVTLPADAGHISVDVRDLPNATPLEAKMLSLSIGDVLDIEVLKDILEFIIGVIQEWLDKDAETDTKAPQEKAAVVEVPKANAKVEGPLQDNFQEAATSQAKEELTDGGETPEEV